MDILYYSNFCRHSQRIVQYLVKNNLKDKLNFICVDKRVKDPKTNQTHVVLENGNKVLLPPNVHAVPSLLLIKENYRVISGDDIVHFFQPRIEKQNEVVNKKTGEPVEFQLGGGNFNILSEKFTAYNMSPEELSAKGKGGNRQMYNYINANHELSLINTPDDNYQPDKIEGSVTLDDLQQKRNAEIPQLPLNPTLDI